MAERLHTHTYTAALPTFPPPASRKRAPCSPRAPPPPPPDPTRPDLTRSDPTRSGGDAPAAAAPQPHGGTAPPAGAAPAALRAARGPSALQISHLDNGATRTRPGSGARVGAAGYPFLLLDAEG